MRSPARNLFLVFIVAAVAGGFTCHGNDPNRELLDGVRAALGETFAGYQAISYPTNNFGLGTIYISSDSEVTPSEFECDMWNCLGYADSEVPAATAWLRMDGYAGLGGNGAQIQLEEETKEDLAFEVVLPAIRDVVGLDVEFERSKVMNVTLNLGRAYPRMLRRQEFQDYMLTLPPTRRLRQGFNAGNLAVVVADVVIEGFTATVEVSQDVASAIDAKLDPQVPTTIIQGAELDVGVARNANTSYSFSVDKPVILLRWIKAQPGPGELGAQEDENWESWRDVSAPDVVKNRGSIVTER